MSRALPSDLAAVAESERSARGNASLRLLRWSAWSESWTLGPSEREARDLDAMIALDVDAPSRETLSSLLAARLQRAHARAEAMRAAGWTVTSVRVEAYGPVPALMASPASTSGFSFDRNLGIPWLAGSTVRSLLSVGATVPAEGTDVEPQLLASMARDLYGDEKRLVVFDALPVSPPALTQLRWDDRWGQVAQEELKGSPVICVGRGTEYEFWFASHDAKLASLAASHVEPGLKALGLAGPLPEPEVIPEPEPEPEPLAEPAAEAELEQELAAAPEQAQEVPAELPPEELGPAPSEGPTTVPEDVATITVRVPSAQYLPNNGRVFVMFVPPDGRDAMKAEEHITAIAMTDELRARLKKKKVLAQVNVDVEAVGNSWRIRGIAL